MPRVKATPKRNGFGYYKHHPVIVFDDSYYLGGNGKWLEDPIAHRMNGLRSYSRFMSLLSKRYEPWVRWQKSEGLHILINTGADTIIPWENRYQLEHLLNRFKRRAIFRRRLTKLAQKARLARVLEELPAAVWAPQRVARWVEAGVNLEDL